MTGPAAATSPFAGFEASVWTCVALIRQSPFVFGISVLAWASTLVVSGLADRGASLSTERLFAIGSSIGIASSVVLALRSQLLSSDIYLPASARTRSLAIALVGTVSSALGLLLAVAAVVTGDFSVHAAPMLAIILVVGAASTVPEVVGGDHPHLVWTIGVALLTMLFWRSVSDLKTSGDLARVFTIAAGGVLLLIPLLPRSWLQYRAPAFLQGGIRDTAFSAGGADPILAVRALLAAERGRSVGWRLVPAAAYTLVRWAAYPLGPGHAGWDLLGWLGLPLLATIPYILPISAFGVQASGVALQLPVPPLRVHHAVIREATIRAGMVYGAFVGVEAIRFGVGALTSVAAPSDHVVLAVLGLWSCVLPGFTVVVGASAWVSHPSPLKVFLVKMVMLTAALPTLLLFVLWSGAHVSFEALVERWLWACALLTLLGLLALLLGELRARRAFRPYRSVA